MAKGKGGAFGMALEKITLDDLGEVINTVDPMVSIMLHGPPGIGKSSWILEHPALQPCEQIGLAVRQPEDIGGCPSIDKVKRVTEFLPCNWFRRFCVSDENPDPVGCIFFDEYDKGTEEKQVAVMRILSERTMEDGRLGDKIRVIVAANRREDAAGSFHEMPKVIRNRLTHFEVIPNFKQWLEGFALVSGVHPLVTGFLDRHPEEFCNYQPSAADYGFPTPRSWDACSKFLYAGDQGLRDPLVRGALVGTIGHGATAKLWEFRTYMNECPSVSELANGRKAFPPDDRPDRWVALVARCIATVEQDLNRPGRKNFQSLRDVCTILTNMPVDNYRLLLATYLQRRPLTQKVWLDPKVVGTDHCAALGKVLMALQGSV